MRTRRELSGLRVCVCSKRLRAAFHGSPARLRRPISSLAGRRAAVGRETLRREPLCCRWSDPGAPCGTGRCKESERLSGFKPTPIDVNVVTHSFQRYAVWFGGSILCQTEEFYQNCHTKAQYDELGPAICRHNAVFGGM